MRPWSRLRTNNFVLRNNLLSSRNLRRGFATEADWYARKFREELGLKSHDPLCPFKLAKHLEISCIALSTIKGCEEAVKYLLSKTGRKEFSAIAAPRETGRMIIFNDSMATVRIISSVSHEIAHIVLGHTPIDLSLAAEGGHFNKQDEAEAERMGPAFLVSYEAALHVAKNYSKISEAAAEYEVSVELMRMRLNLTGVQKRTRRTLAS